MPFIGSIINFLCIIIFSFLGSLVKNGIPERVSRAVLNAVAIAVIYIGFVGANICRSAQITQCLVGYKCVS